VARQAAREQKAPVRVRVQKAPVRVRVQKAPVRVRVQKAPVRVQNSVWRSLTGPRRRHQWATRRTRSRLVDRHRAQWDRRQECRP
jgi:hypothetical protein